MPRRSLARRAFRSSAIAGVVAIASCGAPTDGGHAGQLHVRIDGLPADLKAAVRVTGIATGFARDVTDETWIDIPADGAYVITVRPVSAPDAYYAAHDSTYTVNASRSAPAEAVARYQLAGGSVRFVATGAPVSASPAIRLESSSGVRTVKAGGTSGGIPAGIYTIGVDTLDVSGDRYAPRELVRTVTVAASRTPVEIGATYTMLTATLALTVDGLPDANSQPITIAGPNGFRRTLGASANLHGLAPGTYAIAAAPLPGCPFVLIPAVSQQTLELGAGQTLERTVRYQQQVPPPSALDLRIAGMQLVQVIQDSAGSIPTVAGRPTVVRVFVTANQCNTAMPAVLLTLNTGRRIRIEAPSREVPLVSGSPVTATSWNALLDSSEVTPQLSIVAKLDPDNAIAEADETNNDFSLANVVRRVPPIKLVFVPMVVNGITPDLTPETLPEFMTAIREMLPFGEVTVRIDQPLLSAVIFTSGGIAQITAFLREVDARRSAGDPDEYYIGIYRPAPGALLAGPGAMAQIGGHAAVTTDVMWFPEAFRRPSIEGVAHELTHTFGRFHAPACDAPSPDPKYPYAGGITGIAGYNVWAAAKRGDANPPLISRTAPDIMAYCRSPWISDYTYLGVLRFRDSVAAARVTPHASTPRMPGTP